VNPRDLGAITKDHEPRHDLREVEDDIAPRWKGSVEQWTDPLERRREHDVTREPGQHTQQFWHLEDAPVNTDTPRDARYCYATKVCGLAKDE
jgi:hypothetical protein